MTTEQKVIKAKVGLLELAKQLGSVSQACKIMEYSRDSFYRFKGALREGGRPGTGGDDAQEANREEPRRPGDREGGSGDGDRAAGIRPGSGRQRAQEAGPYHLAIWRAQRVAAPRSGDHE